MELDMLTALAYPDRFAVLVPIERCFAAGTINEAKVWAIIRAWSNDQTFRPLVGVKHPFKERIAIADGHHRFHAYSRLGLTEIPVAVSDEYVYYPGVAAGLNQFGPRWQNRFRPKLRRFVDKITCRSGEGLETPEGAAITASYQYDP